MTPREVRKYPIIWTNNLSQPILARDFRDIGITIIGTGDVQVLGSLEAPQDSTYGSPTEVDFSVASALGNSYAAVVIADLTVPNTYVTTLSVAGATKLGEVNTNLLTWICLSRSIDTVDALVTVCDNQ